MALTIEEQKILDHALAMLPDWFTSDERQQEFLGAAAKLMGNAKLTLDDWFKQTLITTAVGPAGSDPDWLAQHAVDRNSTRQAAESDLALADRLRNVPDALTIVTLLTAAQSIVDAEAIVGTVAALELPRDGAFLSELVSDAGTGGEFFDPGGGEGEFTPDVLPLSPQLLIGADLIISGASSGGNDGTFPITALNGNRLVYTNGSVVAEVDGGASWTHQKRHLVGGEIIDGWSANYVGRGYRTVPPRSTLVFILPFGCTASTTASVLEMLRQKKGAGVAALVECRAVP